MSVVDESKTFGRARLTFASDAEIDEFVATVERYERGEMTPDQWRAYRLVRGTYGQRQAEDAQMLRVKIPQGLLTADQLEALADVGEQYSRGFGHITTRQNIQFHFVKLHDVEPAMRRLADAGLTTREACGNSVRNITGLPVCRGRGRRALRRHAVCRGDDALSASASAQLDAAAQVQDRLRRMPGRSHRHRRSTTWRSAPWSRRAAAAGSASRRAAARRSWSATRRVAPRVPAGVGDLPRRRSRAARVPSARRLPAQAAQPHEVHDSRAGLDAVRARNTIAS